MFGHYYQRIHNFYRKYTESRTDYIPVLPNSMHFDYYSTKLVEKIVYFVF